MRRTSVGRLGLAVLAIAAVCLCGVQGAYAGGPKPVITGAMATPASVPSGGTITVSASVSGATSCTLTSKGPVAGLPATVSCGSGSYSQEVVMPENLGKKAVEYKLSLSATGAGGTSKKAKIDVAVGFPLAVGVAASDWDSCALLINGRVKCWGQNNDGQIGDGKESKKEARVPVEVLGITDATQVSTGGHNACALLAGGHMECWGENHGGQLGDGTTTNKPTPVEVHGMTEATQVDVAGGTACALLASEHVECWGENWFGSLGNGMESGASDAPVEVQGITDAVELAEKATCAVLATGQIDCWGSDERGELGDGSDAEESALVPVEVLGITTAVQASGEGHRCAVLIAATIDCWGWNTGGQLGTGSATGPESCGGTDSECSRVPVEVQHITDATEVGAGAYDTCALLSSGHVECWGRNSNGQLGDGHHGEGEISLTPVEVQGITSATEIVAGESHNCALLISGHIECWGFNGYGQLGNGTEADPYTPVEVHNIG